jgi:hypothetical protein
VLCSPLRFIKGYAMKTTEQKFISLFLFRDIVCSVFAATLWSAFFYIVDPYNALLCAIMAFGVAFFFCKFQHAHRVKTYKESQ